MVIDKVPFDKYELEPSPLTQYILERKSPHTCWQVHVLHWQETVTIKLIWFWFSSPSLMWSVIWVKPYVSMLYQLNITWWSVDLKRASSYLVILGVRQTFVEVKMFSSESGNVLISLNRNDLCEFPRWYEGLGVTQTPDPEDVYAPVVAYLGWLL